MNLVRTAFVIAVLALATIYLAHRDPAKAQSITSCASQRTSCNAFATSNRSNCNSNCHPSTGACLQACTNQYNTEIGQCTAQYNLCIQGRQNNCNSQCSVTCVNTSVISCVYNDTTLGCDVTCNSGTGNNCTGSKPSCPSGSATCVGHTWECNSPILIDVTGDGFSLTSPQEGVLFDFYANGQPDRWSWPAPEKGNAWLVLDRDGNGTIDSGKELFGSLTPQPQSDQPNGFRALAVFDRRTNGGNEDGFIDASDAVYSLLRLWRDQNHNGVSEPGELHTLRELGIARIDLLYQQRIRQDQFGNIFAFRARVWDVRGAQAGRWAWDVYLQHIE